MGYYPNAAIEALTPNTFRAFFIRDFKYLPDYSAAKQYFIDDLVYYPTTDAFYKCIVNSLDNLPTDTDFWIATNLNKRSYILDSDILKAYNQARGSVNPEIFEDDVVLIDAFDYCWAHFLVMDIRMSEKGIDSRGEGMISSKSVGGVSVGYQIPTKYASDPQWAYYAQTQYGQKYLSYIFPRLSGRVGIGVGDTLE
jgi:hypothetical protein